MMEVFNYYCLYLMCYNLLQGLNSSKIHPVDGA